MTESLCPSLCIPRLHFNTSKNEIVNKFNELGIGKVEKVDIICKNSEKGEKFCSAFVHIAWNSSDLSKYIIDRINSGKDVKIIYEGFLFWKVFMNKSAKRRESSNGRERESSNGKDGNKHKPLDCELWQRNAKIF